MAVKQPRRPRGATGGGQFAPIARPEAEIFLSDDDPASDARQEQLETRLGQTMEEIRRFFSIGATIVERGGETFFDDPVLQAAAKSVIVDLQSAFELLPERVKQEYPQIPWRQVKGMRNLIAHEYDIVDFEVVWRVLAVELPALRAILSP
ncbi:MAG: HepT-like ribonuclease domain-containing protein [Acidimicrobiales bacterium]